MRRFARCLALAVASVGLFGLVGCSEDNEAANSNGPAIQKPANTPSPADYGKMMSKSGTAEDGKASSAMMPGSVPPPAAP